MFGFPIMKPSFSFIDVKIITIPAICSVNNPGLIVVNDYNAVLVRKKRFYAYTAVSTKVVPRKSGADLGGGCGGCAPLPEMTYGFLMQLVFYKKNTTKKCGLMVLVTPFLSGAPPPKKNPHWIGP